MEIKLDSGAKTMSMWEVKRKILHLEWQMEQENKKRIREQKEQILCSK